MKKLTLFLCFSLLLVLSSSAQEKKSALFLGNSYTAANNLPNKVAKLAESLGDTLIYDSNTPGGHTLQGHSTNATSIAKINSESWDFVILQDQSQRPSFPPAQVAVEVYPYAESLNNTIEANDSCTETVFYMTWGRKYGDADNCAVWPPVCTFLGMQQRLRESYMEMGVDNDATVSPVGMAFQHAGAAACPIDLWTADNSHPSLAGTYLAACVFYATMFRKSPKGATYYAGLDSADAVFLQHIADSTVMDSFNVWRIGANDPIANFSSSVTGDSASFSNSSTNTSSWYWDFGDGQTSTDENPAHVYTTSGSYVVQLIADNGCTTDTTVDTIEVILTGTSPDSGEIDLRVSPNPTSGILYVSGTTDLKGMHFVILDNLGKIVLSGNLSSTGRISLPVDLSNGIYYLELSADNQRTTHKVWLQRE